MGQWDLRPVARRALTFQRDLKLEYLATTAHTQDPSVDLDALNAAADASRARNNRFLYGGWLLVIANTCTFFFFGCVIFRHCFELVDCTYWQTSWVVS